MELYRICKLKERESMSKIFKREVIMMIKLIIFLGIVFAGIVSLLLYFAIREMFCKYRNPDPLFCNGDKRFKEIIENKDKDYKTRSFLKDIYYDQK